jgi:hypothetical protein
MVIRMIPREGLWFHAFNSSTLDVSMDEWMASLVHVSVSMAMCNRQRPFRICGFEVRTSRLRTSHHRPVPIGPCYALN